MGSRAEPPEATLEAMLMWLNSWVMEENLFQVSR
jgi:hypothetical protein